MNGCKSTKTHNNHYTMKRTSPTPPKPALTLDKKWMSHAWDGFTTGEQYMMALTIAKDLNLFGEGLREPAAMSDTDKKRFVEMTMQAHFFHTYKYIASEQQS